MAPGHGGEGGGGGGGRVGGGGEGGGGGGEEVWHLALERVVEVDVGVEG